MATSVRNATLKVTIEEEINLSGVRQNSENIVRISDINEVSKRIVTIPASEVTVVLFSTAVAAGTFIEGDIRYIRLTNKDDTNYIILILREMQVQILA